MPYEVLSSLPSGVTGSRTRLARLDSTLVVLRALEPGTMTFVGPKHPSVLRLLDVTQFDATRWATYPYLPGLTLKEVIDAFRAQSRQVPIDALARVMIEVARGLAVVSHGPSGHWHNGISDASLLVGFDGHTRVLDYGAPRNPGRFGTRSSTPGASRDVFSLGAVLHSALTGFAGPYAGAPSLPVPSNSVAGVSAALDTLVMTSLSPGIEQRQSSLAQLAQELEMVLAPVALESHLLSALLKRVFRARFNETVRLTGTGSMMPELPPEPPTINARPSNGEPNAFGGNEAETVQHMPVVKAPRRDVEQTDPKGLPFALKVTSPASGPTSILPSPRPMEPALPTPIRDDDEHTVEIDLRKPEPLDPDAPTVDVPFDPNEEDPAPEPPPPPPIAVPSPARPRRAPLVVPAKATGEYSTILDSKPVPAVAPHRPIQESTNPGVLPKDVAPALEELRSAERLLNDIAEAISSTASPTPFVEGSGKRPLALGEDPPTPSPSAPGPRPSADNFDPSKERTKNDRGARPSQPIPPAVSTELPPPVRAAPEVDLPEELSTVSEDLGQRSRALLVMAIVAALAAVAAVTWVVHSRVSAAASSGPPSARAPVDAGAAQEGP